MKSRIFVSLFSLSVAILSLSLGGCTGSNESETAGNFSENNSAVISVISKSEPESSESLENSVPEQKTPDGEPTFLTTPDGTPIYTFEITAYQNPAEFHGTHEQYPLDTFNRETFFDPVYSHEAVCEGFSYAFIPRRSISAYEAPEKFTDDHGFLIYSGDELPPSSEYFRIKTGDKFGSLTVKSASAGFSNDKALWYDGDPDKVPGIYLTGAEIRYEGEVELTGTIRVARTEGYDTAGDLWFYPDGDCVSQIPMANYRFDGSDPDRGIYHSASCSEGTYGELTLIWLGNMYDYGNVDFDGLQPGDTARVKLIVKDPVASFRWGYDGCSAEPVAVTVVD